MHTQVAATLMDIEGELRRLSLWEAEAPDEQALASTQPFALDTLTLPQWLQWIFLPTMQQLTEERRPLPAKCGITPMAEEYFRGQNLPITGLLDALETIDRLLCMDSPDYGLPGSESPN